MIARNMMLLVAALLSACGASGPQFRPETATPSGGGIRLYVYRPDTMIGIINADVPVIHLDGRRLTRIRIGGYLEQTIASGTHKLLTTESSFGRDTGKVRGETAFSAPPGTILYLRYTEAFKSITPIPVPGVGIVLTSTGDYRFEAVEESEALRELAKTERLELDTQ